MNQPHKATVDAQGNIILPGMQASPQTEKSVHIDEVETQHMQEGTWYTPVAEEPAIEEVQWEATFVEHTEPIAVAQETYSVIEEPVTQEIMENTVIKQSDEQVELTDTTQHIWSSVRNDVFQVTQSILEEGARQYRSSITDSARAGVESAHAVESMSKRVWKSLKQPVWVPGRKQKPVQYSRGTLFVLDTVRFGGTFAGLFTLLFVGLNYQSFWSIAGSYVQPLAEVTGAKNIDHNLDKNIADKLKNIPNLAVAGASDNSLIDYLPPVGPPDNRLIIAKLNLNVPIVTPPNTALMNEDWKQLEADIQQSLQDGVVYYPGTARPGQAGNFFLTGHSSYFPWDPGKFKSVFARLGELKVGDEYWVFYGGDRHRYVIQEKKEIKPSDVSVLNQPSGKRISTLMTCTPLGTTLRRLILVSQEVDPVTGLALEVGEHGQEPKLPSVKMEALSI